MLLHTDNKQLLNEQLFVIFHYLHTLNLTSTVINLSCYGNMFQFLLECKQCLWL